MNLIESEIQIQIAEPEEDILQRETSRSQIQEAVDYIKNYNHSPQRSDIAEHLNIDENWAFNILCAALSWIYREKIDDLIQQANTGNLEGAEPVSSLPHSRINNMPLVPMNRRRKLIDKKGRKFTFGRNSLQTIVANLMQNRRT